MLDFFSRQRRARQKTGQLLLLFALAVSLIIVCVYLAVRVAYLWLQLNKLEGIPLPLWDPAMFLAVGATTAVVILGGSYYKIRELNQGGFRVAEMLGGRLVATVTEVPEERRLLNVVEEMAIASGVPVPEVYVMERERGINAFAAGFGYDDAVIAVTRGALHLLDRDELQGVIAHEFSHILNGDTLINLRLIGWLHGLLLIALVGEGLVRGLGRTRSRSGGAVIVLGFSLYLLGYLGVLLGNLIKSAISRQREYLADSSAVQYTRNPLGLAGALKKIGGLSGEGHISHPQAMEASHMYFSSGLGQSWLASLSTHPPLSERILQLDPGFDGVFPVVSALPVPEPMPIVRASQGFRRPADKVPVVSGAAAAAILATIGAPLQEHAALARRLLAGLPQEVTTAARELRGASALIYALLLDRDSKIRDRQLDILSADEYQGVVAEVERLNAHLEELSPQLRLPLMDLALPALRHLSAEQYRVFKTCVQKLCGADGKRSLFEFALEQALLRHLEARFSGPRRQLVQIYGIRGVVWECSCVLSLLARRGHRDEGLAAQAFEHGRRILLEPKVDFEFLAAKDCEPSSLSQALASLAATSGLIKRKLLAACLETLLYDQTVQIAEAELFRAVADALGCPVPPWLMFAEEAETA
ncbi:M48 family metallopeptidase [Trichloromonas sp.]|uniref:M48 family metallopeptidase n=1 Tax=Trichloromonas sp. TaxID=3069249 RepID=UPI003D81B79F